MDDHEFMRMALALAEKGRGYTSPNPMVGAVVVKDGKVVGSGFHEAVGKPHAEVNAIDDAGASARGATLYVTLEPCNHTGRTPPCTEKILSAGIRRVVVAMGDPNPDVIGGGIDFLKTRGLEIATGVGEAPALRLNEAYVKFVRTKTPFVSVKCAATLDGWLATKTGDSKWVSGEASRAYVHELRHAVDGILVGVETVKRDNPALTTRIEGKNGKDPIRIILDTSLSIPERARVLHLNSEAGTFLVCGDGVAAQKKARFEAVGATVVPIKRKGAHIDLIALMKELGRRGLNHILIEGGGRVIASALRAGIVDKFVLFLAPKLLGGDDGVAICRGPGPERMSDSIGLTDLTLRRFGEDIMIEGYIKPR